MKTSEDGRTSFPRVTSRPRAAVRLAVITAAALGSLAIAPAASSADEDSAEPDQASPGQDETDPDRADAERVAIDHLRGLAASTLTNDGIGAALAIGPELRVMSTTESMDGDVTHVYVQQMVNGLDVIGANANVAVVDDDVVYSPDRLSSVRSLIGHDDAAPQIDALAAVTSAAASLDLEPSESFRILDESAEAERSTIVSSGGIANESIHLRLVWLQTDDGLQLSWEVILDVAASLDWWELHVDAQTGVEIDRFNYRISHEHVENDLDEPESGSTEDDGTPTSPLGTATRLPALIDAGLVADGSSYRVFAPGIESPNHGGRTLLTNAADPTASPFGWHDFDGASGADSTLTVGNNVDAYTDVDGDNLPDAGSRADGGPGLDFDFPLDLTIDPAVQTNAAVTQLFVSTNYAHDLFYAYGFDEAAGNFQHHNLGRGGRGNDAVRAEAHGGDGQANASFATPPDGWAPRMSNFFWRGRNQPQRDGVYDQGVVLHEYGHGLSVRLTGGASTVRCLSNEEQGGEGWSDFVGMAATMQAGDVGAQRRGVGTYLVGHTPDGRGIRSHPYSTDLTVDPRTYGDLPSASVPHGVGSIWASMLWQMNWALIDEYGFDPDLIHGNGGNNLAMQLVVDGLKLQPCGPGLVDSRDAILQADVNASGGRNQCIIWKAFAIRGLGSSADQGSPDDADDGVEAFDVPVACSADVETSDKSPDGVDRPADATQSAQRIRG